VVVVAGPAPGTKVKILKLLATAAIVATNPAPSMSFKALLLSFSSSADPIKINLPKVLQRGNRLRAIALLQDRWAWLMLMSPSLSGYYEDWHLSILGLHKG
jgi:hypothetical protein